MGLPVATEGSRSLLHPPHFSTRRNSLRPRVVLVNLLLFEQVLLLTLCHSLCALSRVRLFAIPGTVARQAPLPMGFSRHEHWSGLPCPPPRDLPHPGIELTSFSLLALGGGFFITRRHLGIIHSLKSICCIPGSNFTRCPAFLFAKLDRLN